MTVSVLRQLFSKKNLCCDVLIFFTPWTWLIKTLNYLKILVVIHWDTSWIAERQIRFAQDQQVLLIRYRPTPRTISVSSGHRLPSGYRLPLRETIAGRNRNSSRSSCHLLLGLKQGYPLYSPYGCSLWYHQSEAWLGRAESTTSPTLCSKCHDRDSNPDSADRTPEFESGALNR